MSIQERLLLRGLTLELYDWDDPLPHGRHKEWEQWRASLTKLEREKIAQQYIAASLSQAPKREMHVFCDTSINAIAAVAYVRTIDTNGMAEVGFLFGKAKLAPRPEVTIPRLELCVAVS